MCLCALPLEHIINNISDNWALILKKTVVTALFVCVCVCLCVCVCVCVCMCVTLCVLCGADLYCVFCIALFGLEREWDSKFVSLR
jgi:hypothetical protein